MTLATSGPPLVGRSSCRFSAKLIARRSLGLFRKSGLDELNASMRIPSPGRTKPGL